MIHVISTKWRQSVVYFLLTCFIWTIEWNKTFVGSTNGRNVYKHTQNLVINKNYNLSQNNFSIYGTRNKIPTLNLLHTFQYILYLN